MVTLFIITLVLGLVFPSFYRAGGGIKSDAKMVASVLRYLYDTAAARKETLPLTFDFKDDMLRWNGPEGDKSKEVDTLSGVEMPSRGLVKEGELTVMMSPLGAVENMDVILKEKREGGDSLTVRLFGLSGRVKIIAGDEDKHNDK